MSLRGCSGRGISGGRFRVFVAGVQRTVSEPQAFRAERLFVAPVAPRKTWTGPSTFEYLVVCGVLVHGVRYTVHVQLRKSLSGVLGKSDLL